MKYVSYGTKIVGKNQIFNDTIKVYRKALSFIIDVIDKEWPSIDGLKSNEQNNMVETLIHGTKDNPYPKYNFDDLFYKFPSYFRRSCIAEALGIVSSYNTNKLNYEKLKADFISKPENKGKTFTNKPPVLRLNHNSFPALYNKEMFKEEVYGLAKAEMYTPKVDGDRKTSKKSKTYKSFTPNSNFSIKIYKNNDWVWEPVKLRQQDLKFLVKNKLDTYKSPILEKRNKKYYLRFAFETKRNDFAKDRYQDFKKKDITDVRVCAVDLGVNHSAVCVMMDSKGTVNARTFINQALEKDRMNTLLNRLRKKQFQGGKYASNKSTWTKINNLNDSVATKTAKEILDFAVRNDADIIVMENLDSLKPKKGNKAKVALWKKRRVYEILRRKTYMSGISLSRINPANTSKLAFDGSGEVKRNKDNFSLCTFSTGKKYNADLNAAYNIGSRYFLRRYAYEITATDEKNKNKATYVSKWSLLEAKVPLLGRRTKGTLSTLISLNVALKEQSSF